MLVTDTSSLWMGLTASTSLQHSRRDAYRRCDDRLASRRRGHIIVAVSEPTTPFSLLDAARIVARGGTLESKLEALSAGARATADSDAAAVLLHDPDAGLLLSLDGSVTVPVVAAGAELTAAIDERQPVAVGSVPRALASLLPGTTASLLLPLVVEDEGGAEVEGLLALGWRAQNGSARVSQDALLAIADLTAVAIRHARLRNTAWEESDYAERLLHTDRLTGLANRVTFERMLELEVARATRQGTPLAVAVFDVDGLTQIGASRGAGVADEVLRHVASAIADRVRLLDTVARFGEDEFVVIAPGDAGGMVALRLRDAIAQLPPVRDVEISVSAAVVHHPADGTTGSELVAASESALARARSAGPGALLGVREGAA